MTIKISANLLSGKKNKKIVSKLLSQGFMLQVTR